MAEMYMRPRLFNCSIIFPESKRCHAMSFFPPVYIKYLSFSEKTWDLVITRSWMRDVLVHSGPAEGGGVAVGFLQVW